MADKDERGTGGEGALQGAGVCDLRKATAEADMPRETRPIVACGVTVALQTYQAWLLYNGIFPGASAVLPLAREVQSAASVVTGLLALVAAMCAPRLLRPRFLLDRKSVV